MFNFNIIYMECRIELGKVAYCGSRRINMVELEVCLQDKPCGLVFSMSCNVWNRAHSDIVAGGQMCDELPKLFPGNRDIKRLVNIWKVFHLNDMHAGTEMQEYKLANCGYDLNDYARFGHKSRYDFALYILRLGGLEYDNGYKYGTSWLYRPIPDSIIAEIKSICERLSK